MYRPYDHEPSSADLERIAEFYEVAVDELTSEMLCDYKHDLREAAAER